jgi:hypothetical protein
VQHPRESHVADVAAGAGEDPPVLAAMDAGTDIAVGGDRGFGHRRYGISLDESPSTGLPPDGPIRGTVGLLVDR